jgi:hypothetical protein
MTRKEKVAQKKLAELAEQIVAARLMKVEILVLPA